MAKKKPIVSPLGQWAYPGEVTIIPSSNITMKGVNYPVLGVDDLGNSQMMMPGQNYTFPGEYVTEYPQMQFGGMSKRKIDKILNQNKDLNFVQRLYQSNTPSIVLPGQQYPSTHFMESADGRVYPTVVQMPDGSLQYLGDNAYDYANQTGEYIQFPNDRQARRFAKSYKKGTGVLEEFGKGGLRQWFAEEWTDVKTGKACGRSGDEKGSRPYPACRPKKRVNETTPKTTSEMSSAEKAKFKREKTSGKRIDYNHKRRQDGGEEDSTIENITEFFDPTGIMSWDDASKAYNEWKKSNSTLPSMNQALDMFGAVPGLGKLGKIKYLDPEAIKTAYKYIPWQQIVNAFDTVEDEASKVKKPIKKQDGGETWLDQYQDAGEIPSNIERMQGIDIKHKKKKVSDSPQYQYDDQGNLLYTFPVMNYNSYKDNFSSYYIPIETRNPTLEEFINVASPYYPIDNKLVTDPKINLQPSNYQQFLEEEYVLPQYVGKSFGNLPIVKDDGYSPNRRWVSNLRAKDIGDRYGKDSYAYVLKTNVDYLPDSHKKFKIQDKLSLNNKRFENYLAKITSPQSHLDPFKINSNFSNNEKTESSLKFINTSDNLRNRNQYFYKRDFPDSIWKTAEQMRVEMRNNPEIMSWANLHNVDLGYKGKEESNDSFAPKIPESIYANRLVEAGLPVNTPDYEYKPMETYIVQDPSKFNLAGYFPMNSIMRNAEQKVLNKSGKEKLDYPSPEYFEKEAYIKDEMARRIGVDPSAFNSGEYLIHYNQSPITEYTPGKKYGGWLQEYQSGGRPIYTSNPRDPRIRRYNDSLSLYNKTQDIKNPKYYKRGQDPSWYSWKGNTDQLNTFMEKNNIDLEYTGKFPGKIQPIKVGNFGEGIAYPIYKKPVQPYIYKKPEVVSEVVESPTIPVPVVEPPKPSLIVSNIDRDMYTPGGGMDREYNIGVTLQDGNKKSFRTEKEYQDWKVANNLDISKAKVTEGRGYSYDYYPENKKLGGWLEEYQSGGSFTNLLKLALTPEIRGHVANQLIDKGTTKVAQKVGDVSKQQIFDRYRPIDYPDVIGAIVNSGKDVPLRDWQGDYHVSEEAWRLALGLPTKSKYISPSKYKPSKANDANAQYYSLNNVYDPQKLIDAYIQKAQGKPGQTVQMDALSPYIINQDMMTSDNEIPFTQTDPLQKFTLSQGEDERGKYVSIYDKYDFNVPYMDAVVYGSNRKPYEFYDRFYYKKNAAGKPIYVKQQKNGGQISWLNKYK